MKQLKISIMMLLIFTVLTGFIYPVLVTGVGQVFFLEKINGSLVYDFAAVKGSSLIGQKFVSLKFFHGRPSSVNYDASGSGGSNLGPTNKKLADEVVNRAEQARKDFNIPESAVIPADMLFASASGLDPHISFEAAMLQVQAIASARKIDISDVINLIDSYCVKQYYFTGDRYVNVLLLNTALEKGESNE